MEIKIISCQQVVMDHHISNTASTEGDQEEQSGFFSALFYVKSLINCGIYVVKEICA